MTPLLTAIVCTHNRPEHLAGCLSALARLDDPVDVIVVDSGSQPPLEEVVDRHRSQLGSVRYIYESTAGLSTARNAGVAAAATDIVAFIDDDARPRPDWARHVLSAFMRDPGTVCVGGACLASFETPPPGWLSPRLLAMVGVSNFGSKQRHVTRTADFPFGANIAFRTEALRRIGGFDPRLGRNGQTLISGEESAVVRALIAAGGTVTLEPNAVVDHIVGAERLRAGYYWRRFYWQGVTRARMSGRVRRIGGLVLEIPGYLRSWVTTRDRYYLYRASAETLGHLAEWAGRT